MNKCERNPRPSGRGVINEGNQMSEHVDVLIVAMALLCLVAVIAVAWFVATPVVAVRYYFGGI